MIGNNNNNEINNVFIKTIEYIMAANRNPTTDGSRFVSEMFVPIRQTSKSSEERQRSVWDEMHNRMDQRRKEWQDEVSHMRTDFYKIRCDDVSSHGGSASGQRVNSHGRPGNTTVSSGSTELSNMFCTDADGRKLFRVSFDVSQFTPSEINVQTQDHRLIIHAKHEEKGQVKRVSREFSRQVDIPQNVDPQSLRSTLSSDGVLQVEGLVRSSANHSLLRNEGSTGLHYRMSSPTPPPAAAAACSPSSAVSETDGAQIFRISVDIGAEFEPCDLAVKTVDNKLVVHARHEEKAPGRTSCREFNREFDLPDAVDPMTVTAGMSSEGKLIIEAPLTSYSKGSYSGKAGSAKQPTITLSFKPNNTQYSTP